MKKGIVLVIVILNLFWNEDVKGQHGYFDNNPVWILHEQYVPPPSGCLIDGGSIWYYLKGEIVLGGHTYHKVFRKEFYKQWCITSLDTVYTGNNDTINPYAFLRDTLKQIREWVGGDSVIYDFNLNIGDTIHSGSYTPYDCNCGYTVTAIDSIPVSNFYRKRFKCTDSTGHSSYLLEGIGWEATFLDYVILCPNVSTLITYGLQCYSVGDSAWYPSYSATPCLVPNFTMGIKEDLTPSSEIEIFPNPATTSITIESKYQIQSIKMYNIVGELIRNYELGIRNDQSTTIDVSSLTKGMYFAEVKTEKGVIRKKVMVE